MDAGPKDEGLQVEGPEYLTNPVSSMDNHHLGIWLPPERHVDIRF